MNPNQTPASYLRSLKPIVVRNGQDLHLIDEFCSSEPLLVGIDTETTGLHPVDDMPRLLQISHSGQVVIIDLNRFRPDGLAIRWEMMPEVVKLLTGPSVKVLHNAAFDLNFLAAAGLEIGGPLFDTMIASKVINAGLAHKNDLGSVVGRYLKTELPKDLQKANWSGEITEDMYGYAARDAACLPLLVSPLQSALSYARISEHITLYDVFRLEMMCLRAVASMQLRGFSFDVKQARQLRKDLLTEADNHKLAFLEALDRDIRARHPNEPEIWLPREPDGSFNTREKTSGSIRLGTKVFAGFNPRSTQQMARRFKEAGILLPPDAKGGPSLDQNILAFQRKTRPLIEQYLTWKAIATRVSHVDTLIESVSPVTGRIHANYKQMGTDTGRMSCASPNLQQVPKEGTFRGLFSACDGYTLLVADFSQVELRVAAHLSKEPIMVEAYKAGRDLHTETACRITGLSPEEITKEQRSSAKICFSGDTEVLTEEHGWVSLDSYSGGKVAQYVLPPGVEINRKVLKPGPGYVAGARAPWNGDCGAIEFVTPERYDSFYTEDVWHAADRNVDIMATGNHEILYIDAYGNAIKKPLVEVKAPRYMVAAGYKAKGGGLGVLETRLLAMVTADGSFKQAKNWVTLGFSRRRKIRRCEELLQKLGVDYATGKYSNGENQPTTFFKFKLEEAAWLLDYVDVDKNLNYETCMQDVDAIVYLTEAQYWDGKCIEGQTRDRVQVGTVVKHTADVMQAMAVTSGLPCTVHTQDNPECSDGKFYIVSYAFRTAPVWRPSWKPVEAPAQSVYCVQVASGLILIRRNGKVCVQGNCNFGLLYGAGPATLQKQAVAQYGVDMELSYAKELVLKFRDSYPTLYKWQVATGEGTTKHVLTATGRRRFLVGFNDKFTTRINTRVQGTAGDITKLALAYLWEHIEKAPSGEVYILAVVHDEIVLEVKDEWKHTWAELLQECMQRAGNEICYTVPIVAEVGMGKSWAEAK
jgi:DNA polymerase I-like protein with 3'-5' exonuclease and polymerase domains